MEKPQLNYDNHSLREIPDNPQVLRQFILDLKEKLKQAANISTTISLLGEIGTHLRILEELNEAEKSLLKALELIEIHKLGIKVRAQQEIRLAHVYQWKKDFQKSNWLFEKIISYCHQDADARSYLDFALQHSGKNFFDQARYSEALDCFKRALLIRTDKKSPIDQIASTELAIKETEIRLGIQK